MRRLNPVSQHGEQQIDRRANRRQSYFPGKYLKETGTFVLVALIIAWLVLKL